MAKSLSILFFCMQSQQEKLVLIGMVVAVIVLLGLVVWSVLSKAPIDNSLPKTFAESVHTGLLDEKELNQAMLDDLDENPFPPGDGEETAFLLANVGNYYQTELEWVLERETPVAAQLQVTENNLTAQNALKKEIAFYVLFQYLQEIGQETAISVSEETFDSDATILEADQSLSTITARPLLPSDALASFAAESGLSENDIEAEIQSVLQEFLQFKKQQFSDAVTKYEKAVVAEQLLTWKYLMDAVATGA